jgi:hypothetical protein
MTVGDVRRNDLKIGGDFLEGWVTVVLQLVSLEQLMDR